MVILNLNFGKDLIKLGKDLCFHSDSEEIASAKISEIVSELSEPSSVLHLFVSPYTVWFGCIRQDKRHFRYNILFEWVHTSTKVHRRKR